MRYSKIIIGLAALSLVALPLSVGATVSSTSYQIDPEGEFYQSSHNLSSTSFQLSGQVDPISGRTSSTSYALESGASARYACGDGFRDPAETCDGTDLNGATCASQGFDRGTLTCSTACAYVTTACSSGGGGGGGGGGAPASTTPDEPTVSDEIADLAFTYKTSFLLYGSMDTDTEKLEVNGESEDVEFVDNDSWKVTLSLAYGINTFTLVAIDGTKESDETVYELYRRLIGDITQDDAVNDYDLSKLVGLWGGSNRGGDFNEDSKVDDYDFSMMVARWGTSV